MRTIVLALVLSAALAAQTPSRPPRTLPGTATAALASSTDMARGHARHVWRDTPPINESGTVNAYVEIPRGERRKWEFDMEANALAVDRVMPEALGGYPVNYGFVPQTVSYDGDPFDVLVLGPPLPGGEIVPGAVVGVMFMADEKGLDSKIVVSTLDRQGRPAHALLPEDQERIGDYFGRYKNHEPGKFSKVTGWGSADEGLRYVQTTHAFFRECRKVVGSCLLQ